MQNEQQNNIYQPPLPRKTSHRVLLIIASILVTLIIVISVAFLLKNLGITKNISTEQAVALSPAQIIEAYSKPGAVQALSGDKYTLQTANTSEGTVIFKTEDANYTIDTPTKDTALYAAKDTKAADDKATVQEQAKVFMKERGYTEANNTASASSKNPAFLTFESSGAVCQLSSAHSETNSPLPGYHKMSCVSKEAISKEYTSVNSLLDIYKKDHSLEGTTEIIRTTKTDGNKSLATLELLNDGKQISLLFAAINGAWEFIGNLSEGSESNSNGKYTISPQVQQAMANPKYGDLLTKNILR